MIVSILWALAMHAFLILAPAPAAADEAPTPPKELITAEYSNVTALLNTAQLTLGYNGFLGLLPHEQSGTYMRRPIFKLHKDPSYTFAQLQTTMQGPVEVRFTTPLEYYITGENGGCTFDTTSSSEEIVYETTSLNSISKMHGTGFTGLKIVQGMEKAATEAETGGTVSAETELNLQLGNTKLAQESSSFASTGSTQKTQTYVKRIYYTAGLRPRALINDSFTDDFKSAATALGNDTYDFPTAIAFIQNWGNYVYDSVHMGAMAYLSSYFAADASKKDIQQINQETSNQNFQILVDYQKQTETRTEVKTANGNNHTVTFSSVTRIGEFATTETAGSGGVTSDECRIGNTIAPQIIGFNVRPLWDDQIPLHLFMSEQRVNNFRNHLRNASEEMLRLARDCKDDDGNLCTTNNGTCVTDLARDNNGTYAFWCRKKDPPLLPPRDRLYDFDVFLFNWHEDKDYVTTFMYPWQHPEKPLNPFNVKATTSIKEVRPYQAHGISPNTPMRYRIDQTLYDNDCDKCSNGDPVVCQYDGSDCNSNDGGCTTKQSDRSRHAVALSVVVCPFIRGAANKDYEKTCYRIFYAVYNKVACQNDARTLYYLTFSLDANSPVPSDVQFHPVYVAWNDDVPGVYKGLLFGGANTTDPSIYEWEYPSSEVNQDRFYRPSIWVQRTGGNWDIWNPNVIDPSTHPTVSPTPAPTPQQAFLCGENMGATVAPSNATKTVSAYDCWTACAASVPCLTYTYTVGTQDCFLFNTQVPVVYRLGTDYYAFSEADGCTVATGRPTLAPNSTSSPTSAADYLCISNVGRSGPQVQSTTIEASFAYCWQLCNDEEECYFFTYNSSSNECKLYDNQAPSLYDDVNTSYYSYDGNCGPYTSPPSRMP